MKALPTYQIRIAGRVDETTLASFADLRVILSDQAALHGMLEMIRALGFDLLEARQIDASPPRDDPGATDHGQHGVVRPDGGRRPR